MNENFNGLIQDNFKNSINSIFKEHGAELYITKPTYAYLKLGRYKFYFHNTGGKNVTCREVKLFSDEKVLQHILPYDGWEIESINCGGQDDRG